VKIRRPPVDSCIARLIQPDLAHRVDSRAIDPRRDAKTRARHLPATPDAEDLPLLESVVETLGPDRATREWLRAKADPGAWDYYLKVERERNGRTLGALTLLGGTVVHHPHDTELVLHAPEVVAPRLVGDRHLDVGPSR
jgi:hypothetical protein